MLSFIINIVLQVLVLLIVVPAVTAGAVAVRRGGFFRGLLAVICIGFLNIALWAGLTVITVGMALVAQMVTFGLFGLLVNALAIRAVGGIFKDILYVKNFGAALGAAIVIVLGNYLIAQLMLML